MVGIEQTHHVLDQYAFLSESRSRRAQEGGAYVAGEQSRVLGIEIGNVDALLATFEMQSRGIEGGHQRIVEQASLRQIDERGQGGHARALQRDELAIAGESSPVHGDETVDAMTGLQLGIRNWRQSQQFDLKAGAAIGQCAGPAALLIKLDSVVSDNGANAGLRGDIALPLEFEQCFAQRATADLELFGQLVFSRQPFAATQPTAADTPSQFVDDALLLVKSNRFVHV